MIRFLVSKCRILTVPIALVCAVTHFIVFTKVTHISKAHAANHQLHYGVLSYKPHADETRPYTVRNYTRMAHGPMYIMGVVGGNSSTNSAWDHFRIYGLLDRKLYRSEHLSCCLLYREKGQLITVQSNTISERRFEVPASMWSFHVGCPNDKHAQGLIPLGLAVTFQNNGKCTRDHVTYVKPYFPANYSGKIVIGSKLAYGNINAQLIIEWVEAMRYIGVDKIVTYFLGTLNSDALNVLFHYAAEGFVDLSLYDPAKEEAYPRVKNLTSLNAQRWNDQTTVVYDSFERYSGCRYFAIIDQDEFFIPGKYKTLGEMFDHLEEQYTHPAGFYIRTQYYILAWGNRSSSSDTIIGSYTLREDRPPGFDRRKVFQIPSRVALGGSHTHGVSEAPGFHTYSLPTEQGYIRHFRHNCRKEHHTECMTNWTRIEDTTVAVWAEGFRDKVVNVRKIVLGH